MSAVIANSTEAQGKVRQKANGKEGEEGENKKERKRNIEIDRLIDREKSTRRENFASE